MGDMPIYVGYHSADVWANKKHFLLVSLSKSIARDVDCDMLVAVTNFDIYLAEQEWFSSSSQWCSS